MTKTKTKPARITMDRFIKVYRNSKDAVQCAKKLGVNLSTVYGRLATLRSHGIKMHPTSTSGRGRPCTSREDVRRWRALAEA